MWRADGAPEDKRAAEWLRSTAAKGFIEFIADSVGTEISRIVKREKTKEWRNQRCDMGALADCYGLRQIPLTSVPRPRQCDLPGGSGEAEQQADRCSSRQH
jgi:hypothetical protein